MTLAKRIAEQLRQQSTGTLASPRIEANDTGCRVVLSAQRVDSLACSLEDLSVELLPPVAIPQDRLAGLGENLKNRITYLLEPLRVVESDIDGQVVQLRSAKPTVDGPNRCYFEFLVRPLSVELRRYHSSDGQSRRAIEMDLTHEVIGRLAQDVVELMLASATST